MKSLRLTNELRRAAEKCVWFEPPEQAVRISPRLAAYILTFGSQEDVAALRAQASLADLREYLDAAPPGIFDARSWAYWNLMVGRPKAPPMPTRSFV